MKPLTISKALFLFVVLGAGNIASAATTYSLVKAGVLLPGYISSTDKNSNPMLIKKTINTKSLINLALGLPTNTRVPKNTILAIAAEFSGMSQGGNPTTGMHLLVVDMQPHIDNTSVEPTVLATILIPDNATIKSAEDSSTASTRKRIYKRVGLGTANVQDVGSILGASNADKVQSAGSCVTKKISHPSGPTYNVNMKMNFNGQFHYIDKDSTPEDTKTATVTGGTLIGKGGILGTVTF